LIRIVYNEVLLITDTLNNLYCVLIHKPIQEYLCTICFNCLYQWFNLNIVRCVLCLTNMLHDRVYFIEYKHITLIEILNSTYWFNLYRNTFIFIKINHTINILIRCHIQSWCNIVSERFSKWYIHNSFIFELLRNPLSEYFCFTCS
jgi:hypothetical protein